MGKDIPKYKHDELAEMLYHYLDWKDHITLFNVAIGSRYLQGPGNIPVPDVYRFKKSYNKPQYTSYEIKVQRSDFLQDVKKDVGIGTEEITDENNNKLNVSTIDIVLKK